MRFVPQIKKSDSHSDSDGYSDEGRVQEFIKGVSIMPHRNLELLTAMILLIASLAHANRPTPKPQEVFAPCWIAEPGWETELQLKNNLAAGPLTVTPVLRLASGQEPRPRGPGGRAAG